MPNVDRSAVDTIIQPFQAEYKKATGTKPEADDLVKRTLSEAARTTTTQPVNANADLVAPAARPPAPNSAGAATTPGPAPETPPALTVSVDVNAICTTCKEKLESQHAHATAPATPKP
jgi:hypothetical protein